MKAVFECNIPYFQVFRSAFCNLTPVYSEPQRLRTGSGTPVTIKKSLVGHIEKGGKEDFAYIFQEGAKHNRLTLTDPEEIKGMELFILSRDYIHLVEKTEENEGEESPV